MAKAMLNAPADEFAGITDVRLWGQLSRYLDQWQASTERAHDAASRALAEPAHARPLLEEICDQTCDRAYEISARDCIGELMRRAKGSKA